MDKYLASNIFLPDINNEKEEKKTAYAENLASLESFILLRFSEDRTGESCAQAFVPISICPPKLPWWQCVSFVFLLVCL